MKRWYNAVPAALVAAMVVAACSEATGPASERFTPALTHVEPYTEAGNPSCASIFGPGFIELKVEPVADGTYSDANIEVTIDVTGAYFDWESDSPIFAVIVKGGPNANVYEYGDLDADPIDAGDMADEDLHAPINPSNGQPFGLSHISFCYSLDLIILGNLEVSKTAETHADRDWTWDIEKTGDETELTLNQGQSALVSYTVVVSATQITTNTLIDGTITILNTNDGPNEDITINSITDLVAPGFPATTLECEVDGTPLDLENDLPYDLPAGEQIDCTYEATAWGTEGSGTNVVTVNATRGEFTDDFEDSADWDFEDATLGEETDECIDVYDDQGTPANEADDVFLGEVCADDLDENGEYEFEPYDIDVGALNEPCDESDVVNVARFITNDNEEEGDDDHTVTITEDCENGCTLTQGYWKTHSSYGPAPEDQSGAWDAVGGPDAAFFNSGYTWYQMFQLPPSGGNVYIQLAHQYMAAKLSIEAGADDSAVSAVMLLVEAWFVGKTPATPLTNSQKNTVRGWATTLDNFNNGLIGPGHCDE